VNNNEDLSENFSPTACTGTLIGPDTILTNAHCVPLTISTPGSGCGGVIRFAFGPTPSGEDEVAVECDSVVSVSDITTNDVAHPMDYAILRMAAPITRTPLPMGPTLPLTGQGFTAHLIDPPGCFSFDPMGSDCELIGEYRAVSGRYIDNTLDLPVSLSSAASVSTITGLRIINGNSGSPLVHEGTLLSIVHALRNTASVADYPAGMGFSPSAMATTVGCILDPRQAACGTYNLADPMVIEELSNSTVEAMSARMTQGTEEFFSLWATAASPQAETYGDYRIQITNISPWISVVQIIDVNDGTILSTARLALIDESAGILALPRLLSP
jgi:hypothetical protein